MSHVEHRTAAPRHVRCAVVTISDTRTPENDTSGDAIVSMLVAAGHTVSARALVPDDPDVLHALLLAHVTSGDLDAVITTGGTGISSRDRTYDAILRLLDVVIDGFGELFRMVSYQEIGAAAMMSRACAGLARGTVVISLPGSEAAVRLGMRALVVPELAHMVREARR